MLRNTIYLTPGRNIFQISKMKLNNEFLERKKK